MARDEGNIAGVPDATSVLGSLGSLAAGDGAGGIAEVPPGTDGQIPVYDSTQPGGLRAATVGVVTAGVRAAGRLYLFERFGG